MARSEYFRGAPRLRDTLGFQALIASGVIQRVMSPRWTRALSWLAQLETRYLVLYFGWTREFMPEPSASDALLPEYRRSGAL
ncbi:MAG: hypothetical protein ACI8QZ_004129 [Chlamydiales bacterium]|jgi:hypothetical protein